MNTQIVNAKELIRNGNLAEAIELLLEITRGTNSRFQKEVILHSANIQQMLKEERLGIVSLTHIRREKTRIASALLDLLDEMKGEESKLARYSNNKNTGPEKMLKIFLCHSSGDKPRVRQLYERLKLENGIYPWLDTEKLLPGVDWDFEIKTAVRQSHVVLVCLSKNSINKEGYIQKEIKQALDVADEKPDGTIFIIPLRLDDCTIPVRLQRWQWLDLFEKDSYDKLLNSLRKRADDIAKKDAEIK